MILAVTLLCTVGCVEDQGPTMNDRGGPVANDVGGEAAEGASAGAQTAGIVHL